MSLSAAFRHDSRNRTASSFLGSKKSAECAIFDVYEFFRRYIPTLNSRVLIPTQFKYRDSRVEIYVFPRAKNCDLAPMDKSWTQNPPDYYPAHFLGAKSWDQN